MSLTDTITLKEKEALDALKTKVSNEVPKHLRNDTYLYLRFLRAREFNIGLAENMLRKHLVWRKANNIDSILKDFVSSDVSLNNDSTLDSSSRSSKHDQNYRRQIILKYLPTRRITFDKDGNPVRYFDFGGTDTKGLLKTAKKIECVMAIIRSLEEDIVTMRNQSSKLGKAIEQWTYIFDFEGYSLSKATHKPTLEALIELFMAYEANYPERLKNAYIINASVYFSLMFAVIKPLLSGATIKKVVIFGKEGWKEELLKHMDPDQLPAFLGGTRTDPDGNPRCKTFVKHGEIIPQKYYMTKSPVKFSSQPGVSTLNIPRLSKSHLKLSVTKPNSLIQWEFETEGKDIGFGLLYKNSTNDETAKELVPVQRFDTHMVTEIGSYLCEWPGIYILVFDNSYSWMHQKEIYYKASVVDPSNINRD